MERTWVERSIDSQGEGTYQLPAADKKTEETAMKSNDVMRQHTSRILLRNSDSVAEY